MAVFKEVWTVSGFGDRWQEVWYKNSNSIDTAVPVPGSLIDLRRAFLGIPFQIEKIRVSHTLNERVTDQQTVNQPGLAGLGATEFAGSGETVVYGLKADATGARRRLNIRGLPSSWFISRSPSSPQGSPVATLETPVKNFMIALQAAGYLIYSRYKPGDQIDKLIRVLKVDGTAADGNAVLTMQAPFVTFQPDFIRLRQFPKKNVPGLNGSWKVLKIAGNLVTINYVTPENALINTVKGVIQGERFHNDGTITASKTRFLFVGTRQVKNVGIGSRGAQRAQRTRTQA